MATLLSVSVDNIVWLSEQGVEIRCIDAGFDTGAVILSPTNTVDDPGISVLTVITEWTTDRILLNLPFNEPYAKSYWFVRRADGLTSMDGFPVSLQYVVLGAASVWLPEDDGITWYASEGANMIQSHRALPGVVRRFEFDFSPYAEIAAGQVIVGTPTVVSDQATGIALGGPLVDATQKKVQLQIAPSLAGKLYLLSCTAITDGGATLIVDGYLVVG